MSLVRNVTDKPLCPNGVTEPIHEAHLLRTRLLDAFYNAAEKDEETLEMPEPLEKAYGAAAYGGSTDDRMDLYHETVFDADNRVMVQAYWFRCHICGLTLPATATPR